MRSGIDPAPRHAAYFHELDAWTEYWDVYQPASRGRFYFGDDRDEPGLLRALLPRDGRPPAFAAWTYAALHELGDDRFLDEIARPVVRAAVVEVEALVAGIFARHFGDARDPAVRVDYLAAMHGFAIDALPRCPERASRLAPDDPRRATAGSHTLDGDLMWFAWALVLEAAHAIGADGAARRALMMAGVATGCAANFAWRGHRRTRARYRADAATAALLRARGLGWADDFAAGVREVRALYRIREWGED